MDINYLLEKETRDVILQELPLSRYHKNEILLVAALTCQTSLEKTGCINNIRLSIPARLISGWGLSGINERYPNHRFR